MDRLAELTSLMIFYMEALRALGDQMRDKVDGVVVLAAKLPDGKISILAMILSELYVLMMKKLNEP